MGTELAQPTTIINFRAVLILLLLLIIGFDVFLKLRQRVPSIVITRGPLKPITPRLTADRLKLLADLKARRFDSLEKSLDSFQKQAENNMVQEANVALAFQAFQNNGSEIDSLLSQWVKQSPASYSAHLAWATYLFQQGWSARGNKWANETTQRQFAKMQDFFSRGVHEALAALNLNPKLSQAYALLLQSQRAAGGPGACLTTGAAALHRIPASFIMRVEVMKCLQPRWGGSYEAMERFAHASQAFAVQNPRIFALNGYPDLDRGNAYLGARQYPQAIGAYTRAIERGGDDAVFYRQRGQAFALLDQFQDAIEDLHRADQLWPQFPATLDWLAYAFSSVGKKQEALDELNLDEQVGGPTPNEQRMRTSIMMELKQSS
jgi:tetratricopeptide (TPR) repeat protein